MTLIQRLKAKDHFDQLESEEEDRDRKSSSRKSQLQQIVEGFEKATKIQVLIANEKERAEMYGACLGCAPLSVDYDDIQKFITFAKSYEGDENSIWTLGHYTSVLINRCDEKEIHLDYTMFDSELCGVAENIIGKSLFLKVRNIEEGLVSEPSNCEIYVEGYAGDSFAYNVRDSNITLNGDAGRHAVNKMWGGNVLIRGSAIGVGSEMNSGSIHVEGDVKEYLGHSMKRGKIYIKGDTSTKCSIGFNMSGGTININGALNGEIEDNMTGGNIYHRGKLIVENGRRIR
jgi:hypothetical protein